MAKSVKVHDDTHRALKEIKTKRRSSSIDQVIREMIKSTTGLPVEQAQPGSAERELTNFLG